MAQAKTVKNYNTFVRGLITEANPLTYPEDASIDESNFVLNSDGSRQRRLGIDFEPSYSLSDPIPETAFNSGAVTSHIWRNAGNDNVTNFAVIQTGSTIRFYKITGGALSSSESATTIDLSTYSASSLPTNDYPVSVASGLGRLYIVSQAIDPLQVDYDTITGSITVTQLSLRIRDFYGVDDGLAVDENPSTLTPEHEYNLHNQGWGSSQISSYKSSTGVYPDNTQIWVYGKDASDNFNPALLDKQSFGNTQSPKGHYIVNPFNIDRDSYFTGAGTVVDTGRPSTVEFFSGRVFYAGVKSSVTGDDISNNGNIFFSQIITVPSQAEKCYQDSDPTSEQISDLLPNDGGVITIPDSGIIHKIVAYGNSLIVFTDNGVWSVIGGAGFDTGFSADDYQVNKVTNIGAINSGSVVYADNVIVYWADTGIYLVSKSQTSLIESQDISINTIRSLYTSIPSVSRVNCWGTYDSTTKKVSWLYNDDDTYDGISYRNKYTKELILDLNLNAFHKNSIDASGPYIASALTTPSLVSNTTAENIVHPDATTPTISTQVQTGGVDVVVDVESFGRATTSTRYLTVVPNGTNTITFSIFNNNRFLDWYTYDSTGVDYTSYLLTGQEIFKDSSREKRITYMTCNFKRTEDGYITDASGDLQLSNPSGCLIQSRWDFSDSSTSGKWGTQFQAYRFRRPYFPTGVSDPFDYGYEVISTKNKVRGSGKAISFYISSETGKDMYLLGWTLNVAGNTQP